MSIRTLIVDDEPWARTRIRSLLNPEQDFTLVGECGGGAEAVHAITELAPQVVFLDVQMPDVSGFDVVEAVGVDAMPLVVFATAHQEHALRAFDAGAVDYLLKPVSEERFRRSIERVRRDLGVPGAGTRALGKTLRQARATGERTERLAVSKAGRVLFIRVADISWIEAAGNYVTLHVGRETHMMRETLRGLAERLDPKKFVQLHRSAIVNVDRLRELMPWSRGEQVAVLEDGTQLTIGRAYRDHLLAVVTPTQDGG